MSRTGHIAVALNHLARHAPATLAWGVALVFILVVTTLFIRAGCFRLWQRLTGIKSPSRSTPGGGIRLRIAKPTVPPLVKDDRPRAA